MSDPHASAVPSPWIVRHAHLVRPGARVLDVAAGQGRHARFLASLGARVTAVDRSSDALAALRDVAGIVTQVVDLESAPDGAAWPFPPQSFDVIVVANYLHRPLLAPMRASLAVGGVVVYETFMQGNEAYGRPTNPAFLLAPGELLAWAAAPPALRVVAFEQGIAAQGGRRAVVQRVVAARPRDGAPLPLAPDPPG